MAFHPYPPFIPSFFNISGFAPPVGVTRPSHWPWIDRPVSGLLPATDRPIKTRFPYASPIRLSLLLRSKSLTHYTKGTPSPCPRTGSDCLYAYGFRFYFTPLTGVLFAFPSRYWFTIGRQRVFSLGGWSPHVQTRLHVPRPTRFHLMCCFVYGAFTLYGVSFLSTSTTT